MKTAVYEKYYPCLLVEDLCTRITGKTGDTEGISTTISQRIMLYFVIDQPVQDNHFTIPLPLQSQRSIALNRINMVHAITMPNRAKSKNVRK